MKTPPFLLGAALIFWGWASQSLLLALLMAIILEGSRVFRVRWDFSLTDFTRIADVTAIIVSGLFIYLFFTEGILGMGFILLQWLPALFFLLIVTQYYSTQECFEVQSLFWLLRRRQPSYDVPEARYVNLSYPYVVICLIAASTMNIRSQTFYVLLLLLAAWALWSIRADHYPHALWIAALLMTVYIGYQGQFALTRLQRALENSSTLVALITGIQTPEVDPYKTTTAIGSLGTVKLSNHVAFRIKSETGAQGPLLLREATYNTYQHSRWFAVQDEFLGLEPETNRTSWVLLPEEILRAADPLNTPKYWPRLPDIPKELLISARLEDGKGLLRLPTDTVQIDHLNVSVVLQNRFGVVKVDDGPNILTYTPVFGAGRAIDSPPDARRDLEIPPDDAAEIRALADQYHLKRATAAESISSITEFFQQSFSYSLTLQRSQWRRTPILDFLQNTRSGHCEYFATATVLLARAVGIPARYAVGYAVDRVAADRWTFVHGREAHAWALVYVNDSWQNLDTTPPSWRPIEQQDIASAEWASTLWASIEFTLSEWVQRGYVLRVFLIIGLLCLPVLSVRIWRWYRQKRKVRRPLIAGEIAEEVRNQAGADSAFFAIIAYLHTFGIPRHEWEPLSRWLERLNRHLPPQAATALPPLLRIHYRYRFDPDGLSAEERAQFQVAVRNWLEYAASVSASHSTSS